MEFGTAVPSHGPMATTENIATLTQKGEENYAVADAGRDPASVDFSYRVN